MGKVDVVYGVPDTVSEAQLLAAFRVVTDNFDESPTRMHVVLGPAGRGMRWFTFACASLGPGRVLMQDHFTESIGDLLAMTVVSRSGYGTDLRSFEAASFTLVRDGAAVHVRGALPAGARRDGDIDQIGLGALGLDDAIRPLDAIEAPTHEVVLRADRARVTALAIVPLAGPILPTRVEAREPYGTIGESFALAPRAIEAADPAALAAHFAAVSARIEAMYVGMFEGRFASEQHELARVGPGIAPLLEAALAAPRPKPRTARLAIAALAELGRGAAAMVPWAAKVSPLLSHTAYCGLVALGERARAALVAARESRKAAHRAVGETLLAILDGAEWEPVRAARAHPFYAVLADKLASQPQEWTFPAFMASAPPEAMWVVAASLVDRHERMRQVLIRVANAHFGAAFGPVADLVLRFPPLADEVLLIAAAKGAPLPTEGELIAATIAAHRAKQDAKSRP